MAKNLIQDGTRMPYVNNTGGAIASGQVVAVAALLGVALVDIADTESGNLAMDGVYECPKVSAAVIAQGEGVIWIVASSSFDDDQATPAAGDVSGAAVAWAAAGAGETTVKVKLNDGGGSVT